MEFPYPLILCDIGGTNVRVALVREARARIELLGHLKTAAFAGLAEAIEAALANHALAPRSVIACAAGPMNGRELKLTNAPWDIDGPAIAEKLGLAQGLLLNDFEAQALALPVLERAWLTPLGAPDHDGGFGSNRSKAMNAIDSKSLQPDASEKPVSTFSHPAPVPTATGTRVILGPGTGLGAAALVESGGRFIALPSEVGHISFGPANEEEAALWPHLERAHGRLTVECVLSGPGLVRLHKARFAAAGRGAPLIDDVALVDRAVQDRAGEEARTLRLFWRLIGRFSGDLALAFLARGGVTFSGGILPRLLPLLDAAEFRAAFEAKAPVEALVKSIATELITAPDAVLTGMAAIAAEPERYGLDYAGRKWR